MKNFLGLLLSFFLLLFISCKEKVDHSVLTIIKFNCGEQIRILDGTVATLQNAIVQSGSRKIDLKVLESALRIKKWKKPYLDKQTESNLIAYSDSVVKNYPSGSYEDLNFKELVKSKKAFENEKDSLGHFKVLYWALMSENNLQAVNANKVGYSAFRCSFGGGMPSEISAKEIKLGEPIFMTFELYDYNFSDIKYDLDQIFMENKNSNTKTKIKPFKVGDRYVLHAIPQEQGEYIIKGKIPTNLPKDHYQFLTIYNSFKVTE